MMPVAVVLGSLTVPGRPEQVSIARRFVAALAGHEGREGPGSPTAETAALLTSELVTNAVLHTSSGGEGGTVTVVVVDVPAGLLVEVIDNGSADSGPEVSGDRYATEGHGLFLVEQLAARWGFLQDATGTTVWFQIEAGDDPVQADPAGDELPGRAGYGRPGRTE
jgi:anti-sigma regulatory factor (Ser/Thr protein kinase)